MSSPHHEALELRTDATGPDTVRITVLGDLEYDTVEDLLLEATATLARHPAPAHLRLDLARLGVCDSMGLSALLQVHRCASAAGARLHLDNRPASLNRLLDITGTREHFATGPGEQEEPGPDGMSRTDVKD